MIIPDRSRAVRRGVRGRHAVNKLISAPAAMEALGETRPEALVGHTLAVPTENGAVEYRLDEYLFQQDAFVATLVPPINEGTHPVRQNPEATQVRVCRCGKWPDHHVHGADPCGCDDCRSSQFRVYLDRNPQEFAQLLRREIRLDPAWWRRELAKQVRIDTARNVDQALRP